MIDKSVKWAITTTNETVVVLKYGKKTCKVAKPGDFNSFEIKTEELTKANFYAN